MAGAGRRTFVPGEVLTASNVNSYLMDQAVMVFANATARDVALGTAVVSRGMVSYLGNTNALSFYDGAAWRTLGSVSGLPVVAGGTGGTTVATAQDNLGIGLVNIVPPTVNFSGGTATLNSLNEVAFTSVSSISFNNVFNSNYTNYRIMLSAASNAHNAATRLRFRAGGTDETSTTHFFGGSYGTSSGTLANWNGASQNNFNFGTTAIESTTGTIDVFRPALTVRTGYQWQAFGFLSTYASMQGGGMQFTTTSYDGFTIFTDTALLTGTLRVFGYNS